jgi:hypothetical protein
MLMCSGTDLKDGYKGHLAVMQTIQFMKPGLS